MAEALINTKFLPAGLMKMKGFADKADAYHKMQPYPRFALANWKTEDLGPLPRCLPLPREIVNRGAKWLFGKPIQIVASGNTKLETAFRNAWTENGMGSRMVPIAARAARQGGVFLKYSVDETADIPIRIQSLSPIDEARLYYHPHDAQRLLMARIQYKYYDAATNKHWWYREEWTDAKEVHYSPVPDDVFQDGSQRLNPDNFNDWEIISADANRFGRIPGHHIKNLETDDVWGAADLWNLFDEDRLYEVVDKINIAFWLMDMSNQFDSRINPIVLDGEVDDQDIDKPLQPGQAWKIDSVEGKPAARIVFPSGANQLRPAMMEYVKELRQVLYNAASSVEFTPENFTNKGNLTQAVLTLLFQLQIEITEEKHKSYGDQGLEVFFENLAKGAQNAGLDLGVTDDEESFDIEIKWAPYFTLNEDEKTTRVARIEQEEQAGYTTHERAVDQVAHIEGVDDVQALKEELAKLPPPVPPATVLPDMTADQPGATPANNRPQ